MVLERDYVKSLNQKPPQYKLIQRSEPRHSLFLSLIHLYKMLILLPTDKLDTARHDLEVHGIYPFWDRFYSTRLSVNFSPFSSVGV